MVSLYSILDRDCSPDIGDALFPSRTGVQPHPTQGSDRIVPEIAPWESCREGRHEIGPRYRNAVIPGAVRLSQD